MKIAYFVLAFLQYANAVIFSEQNPVLAGGFLLVGTANVVLGVMEAKKESRSCNHKEEEK